MPQRYLPKVTLLILWLLFSCATVICAGESKTGNLIILSGGHNDEHWRESDKYGVSGLEGYFALGSISLVARSATGAPIEVEVWSRGIAYVGFFELTPLVDLFAGVQSSKDIQDLLVPLGAKTDLLGMPSSDRDKLEYLLGQKKLSQDANLTWKRRVAYAQMKALNLTTFEQLRTLYERQLEFAERAWDKQIEPEAMLALYGLDLPPHQNPPTHEKLLSYFIETLKRNKLLMPLLRTKIQNPSSASKMVGYVLHVPQNSLKKTSGQILVGANGLEPEMLEINLEVEREVSIFRPWSTTKFLSAILTPTITGIVGTLLGAIIGYLGFLAQQKYNRASEAERKFEEKKIENSVRIRKFFTGEYANYQGFETEEDERENVSSIRKSLIQQGIYAILPINEINDLNSICDSNRRFPKRGARLLALRGLLERRFRELVT